MRRLEQIAEAGPSAILLREKELSPAEYQELAAQVIKLCAKKHIRFIAHTFIREAQFLGCKSIHLPLPLLRQSAEHLKHFEHIGASVHSVEEAQEAQNLGATCLMAGHIYETDCKKDLTPRGLSTLQSLCRSAGIPVYAIGGISPLNIKEPFSVGAHGVCIMSGLMQCEYPQDYMQALKKALSP